VEFQTTPDRNLPSFVMALPGKVEPEAGICLDEAVAWFRAILCPAFLALSHDCVYIKEHC
jgi:hypothetical protein